MSGEQQLTVESTEWQAAADFGHLQDLLGHQDGLLQLLSGKPSTGIGWHDSDSALLPNNLCRQSHVLHTLTQGSLGHVEQQAYVVLGP